MDQRPFLIHALSPLHAGTGQALGHIDLPIARYRATDIPFLPGSSIKGVLRDATEPASKEARDTHRAVFGPDGKEEDPSVHAGAVAFGDARLLLLPVRSLRGTFAFATCPLLLRLATADLAAGNLSVPPTPRIAPKERKALVAKDSALLERDQVFFEDIERKATTTDPVVAQWAKFLGEFIFAEQFSLLTERLAIVDDETMDFFWRTCTQVDARIRLTDQGVVQDGALWYEESLPAETLLVGLASADRSRRTSVDQSAQQMLDFCLSGVNERLQFGGKSSVGRGRARLIPVVSAKGGV